ncbi:alpha/beta hydrolase [Paenibacillus sp. MMS20-IR301]|uniref:alpha/beta hydrolase n=1 Tax=Paenibacillus sp. MMS20-IR301 TaxID=2895946 RepID=UPI0028E42AAC|nr:alpha/beta hydrolase [Paenibacillus sp. MMS20-IR301]WNS44118.1 alpha/beta hydrolase [Paenibacillus sp. MMS20-IR301]
MKMVEVKLNESGRVKLTGYIQESSKEMGTVAAKPAVLIFPGGAYMFLSDREAEPVALAYAAAGFQAFVLRYSVGKHAGGFQPLKEASEAIAMIREHAADWHVLPEQIAVCGFSAGGHLACAAGLRAEHRPNAMILGYPAIDLGDAEENKQNDHKMVENLMGTPDYTQEELDLLNLHKQVGADAPPAFIWTTFEDVVVGVQHTLKLVTEYAARNLPFEYHVFQRGEHGLSLSTAVLANGRKSMVDAHAAKWFELSTEWLRSLFGELEVIDKPFEFNFDDFQAEQD